MIWRCNFKQPDGSYETYILSAWHVAAGMKADWTDPSTAERIEVHMYIRAGEASVLHADIVVHDETDAVLLRIKSDEALTSGVKLPTREEAANNREMFQPVYASRESSFPIWAW